MKPTDPQFPVHTPLPALFRPVARHVRTALFCLFSLPLLAASACTDTVQCDVIPRPVSVRACKGHLKLDKPLRLWIEAPDSIAQPLRNQATVAGLPVLADTEPDAGPDAKYLRFILSDAPALPGSAEGYALSVRPSGITVRSRGAAGLFYGLQTLVQLHEQYGRRIPALEIADAPRFGWRGLHLDVSRHFFDKEFVLKQLRMMASLKLNRLHWHLTDGAGWRLAVAGYPRLTEVAAWRRGATWQQWQENGRRYCHRDDPGASGGYYSKAQIREVVAAADSLHITIIPEIELPGHSEEVLAVYPELSCSGRPDGCGELCLGNELTYFFLENVLTEVMELFPSEYIHIGGDEASAVAWAACPKCRARMEREGMRAPEELQGYAVRRIGRFLDERGRRLIGWDEMLDRGATPDAAVMAWRGQDEGGRAAAAGHPVVMAPVSHCYLDSYQDDPTREPLAMTGYLPLSKVYGYDPAPDSMTCRERVLGVQANLWTEYISTPEQAEYMLYPRLFALAETAWSDPAGKDFADFRRRALLRCHRAQAQGYNVFDLDSEAGERPEAANNTVHSALGCPVAYTTPWHTSYPAAGAATLTDGERGGWSYGERWQGFLESDVDVTVDLGSVRPIRRVTADFIQWYSAWVWLPRRVEIYLSDDGSAFRPLCAVENDYPADEHRPAYRAFGWRGEAQGRYVRYRALSNGRPGGWLFTDEIVID